MNLLRVSRSFTHPKVLQMNHKDANPAVMPVRIPRGIHSAETEKCSKPLVQLVAKLAKFHLSLVRIALYIAASALQTDNNINLGFECASKEAHFFRALAFSGSRSLGGAYCVSVHTSDIYLMYYVNKCY